MRLTCFGDLFLGLFCFVICGLDLRVLIGGCVAVWCVAVFVLSLDCCG